MRIKIDTEKKNLLFLFLFTHLIIFLFSTIFNIAPFMSYDDKVQYFGADVRLLKNYSYYLENRQIFLAIAAYLNSFFSHGEWLNGTRIFNVIISYFCIVECERLCDKMGYNEGEKKLVSIVLVFSPLIELWMGTLYKDVLCTFLVLKLLNIYSDIIKNQRINYLLTVFYVVLLYFVRAGIIETLIFFTLIYFIRYNKSIAKYFIIFLIAILVAGLYLKYASSYTRLMNQKIEGYINTTTVETGMLRLIRINSIKDIWKLPICAVWLQISPIPTSVIVNEDIGQICWYNVVSYLSVIQYFLVPFFWYFVFFIKKCILERYVLFFYLFWLFFIAITELNAVRFYIFVMPLFYIFSMKGIRFSRGDNRKVLECASIAISLIWVILFVRSLL